MQIEKVMTSEEMLKARVGQAYFSRIVGISKMRVSQLSKAGLFDCDENGVLLIESLQNWYQYKAQKGSYTVEEFVKRFLRR